MFTIEEITIMKLYRYNNQSQLLADLKEAEPHIDEADIKKSVSGIIKTLSCLSRDEFFNIDFSLALENF